MHMYGKQKMGMAGWYEYIDEYGRLGELRVL
jgi:hypothetical protein